MDSLSRRYYEHQLGAGMGPSPSLEEFFGYTEPIRRLVQREEPTPQANEISNTMPSWLPGDDYLINFRKGDPFAKIDQGYARLPGAGYAAVHPDLKDVKPENYTRALRPVPHKKSRAPARKAALLVKLPRCSCYATVHLSPVSLPPAPLPRCSVPAGHRARAAPEFSLFCSIPLSCCCNCFLAPPGPSHSLAVSALWGSCSHSRIRSCRLLDYWITGSVVVLLESCCLFAG